MKRPAVFLLLLSTLLIITGCQARETYPTFTEEEASRLFIENQSVMELVAQDIINRDDVLRSPVQGVQIIMPNTRFRPCFPDVEWNRLTDCFSKGWCRIVLQEKSGLKLVGFTVILKDKKQIAYYYINDSALKQYIVSPYTDIDDHWLLIHLNEG